MQPLWHMELGLEVALSVLKEDWGAREAAQGRQSNLQGMGPVALHCSCRIPCRSVALPMALQQQINIASAAQDRSVICKVGPIMANNLP